MVEEARPRVIVAHVRNIKGRGAAMTGGTVDGQRSRTKKFSSRRSRIFSEYRLK
jgi:hypothetical protein